MNLRLCCLGLAAAMALWSAPSQAAFTSTVQGDCLAAHGVSSSGALAQKLCRGKGTCGNNFSPGDNPSVPCYYQASPSAGQVTQWQTADSDGETIVCCDIYRSDDCHKEKQPCWRSEAYEASSERKWFVNAGSSITLNSAYSLTIKGSLGDILASETTYSISGSWNFNVSGGYEKTETVTSTSVAHPSALCCGKTFYDTRVWARNEPVSADVSIKYGPNGINCTIQGVICYHAPVSETTVSDTITLTGVNAQRKYTPCDIKCDSVNGNCCGSSTTGDAQDCDHLTPEPIWG